MTNTKRARIEAESWSRYLADNWHLMLGGNIAIAAKLSRGKHWIHIPVTNYAGL